MVRKNNRTLDCSLDGIHLVLRGYIRCDDGEHSASLVEGDTLGITNHFGKRSLRLCCLEEFHLHFLRDAQVNDAFFPSTGQLLG